MSHHRRSICYILVIKTGDDTFVVIVWVIAAVPGTFGGGCFFFQKSVSSGVTMLASLAAKVERSAMGELPFPRPPLPTNTEF
jgi:hypothetical protein